MRILVQVPHRSNEYFISTIIDIQRSVAYAWSQLFTAELALHMAAYKIRWAVERLETDASSRNAFQPKAKNKHNATPAAFRNTFKGPPWQLIFELLLNELGCMLLYAAETKL